MPLHIDSIPSRITKGNLLRWILDTDEVRKQQVGSIEIRGPQAIIEVPESAGPRLARRLDGQSLMGRTANGRTLEGSADVATAILQEARVATIAGAAFGADRHLRLSFVRPLPELDAACDALQRFVSSVR